MCNREQQKYYRVSDTLHTGACVKDSLIVPLSVGSQLQFKKLLVTCQISGLLSKSHSIARELTYFFIGRSNMKNDSQF